MLLILAALALLAAEPDRPPTRLPDAKVTEVTRTPMQSGYIAFWHRVRVSTGEGQAMDLFVVSQRGDADALPVVGDRCEIIYRLELVGGSLGPPDVSRPWPAVQAYDCRPSGARSRRPISR